MRNHNFLELRNAGFSVQHHLLLKSLRNNSSSKISLETIWYLTVSTYESTKTASLFVCLFGVCACPVIIIVNVHLCLVDQVLYFYLICFFLIKIFSFYVYLSLKFSFVLYFPQNEHSSINESQRE